MPGWQSWPTTVAGVSTPPPRKQDEMTELETALESGNFAALVAALKGATATNAEGCWVWPDVNHRGYPRLGREFFGFHRQVLEAKEGKPLGKDQAHHACGVRACVNPNHLVANSARENIGEMQQRKYFLARIAELEAVVRDELGADHPVLNRIGVLEP